MLLKGKKGVILGLANNKSIAYGIAKIAHEQGAEIAYTYMNERFAPKVQKATKDIDGKLFYQCDTTNPDEIKALAKSLEQDMGKIDFIVHSIAFADKEGLGGNYYDVSKEAFLKSLEISAYSLVEITRELKPLLNENSSILTLTYYGGVKYIPNYNLMGVAKAALDASVKYLAQELGKDKIRVNAISAGPIKTLAASGISDFSFMLKWNEANAPLRKNVSIEEVGQSGVYMLSDFSSGVTGEIHYVDCGYSIMGMPAVQDDGNGHQELVWRKDS